MAHIGQVIMSISTNMQNKEHVIEALRRTKFKFPGRLKMHISKNGSGLRTLRLQLYYSNVPADGKSWDPVQGSTLPDQGLWGQLPSKGPVCPQGECGGGAWVKTVGATEDKIRGPHRKDLWIKVFLHKSPGRGNGTPVPEKKVQAGTSQQRRLQPEALDQGSCHVELCFLSWFRTKKLFPNQQYHITWYLSWSPCLACAVRVAEFLMENRKVSLRIFTAHLCFKKPESRDALRRLYHQGASVKIMSFPEFNYCWENFVYNEGMTFQPWKKLRKTYKLLHKNLEEILRNPMERLDIRTFSFHFRNLRHAYGRNRSYLCFWVERVNPWSSDSSDFGVFVNQASCHAELSFLSWFLEEKPSPDEQYEVTWYLPWSPCLRCSEQVAEFLRQNKNVTLSIFASRLYYFKKPEYRDALRRLYHQAASVKIMSFSDFDYCWENFVYNQGMPFKPWEDLHENYEFLAKELEEILGKQSEGLGLDLCEAPICKTKRRPPAPEFLQEASLLILEGGVEADFHLASSSSGRTYSAHSLPMQVSRLLSLLVPPTRRGGEEPAVDLASSQICCQFLTIKAFIGWPRRLTYHR
ncbi:DNA dC-_dU-editing enzyme APOBEC-3F-like [Hippopotamus amphibius kiboko]|uniref:DNA dC->dU-editing enzyme APOBEC-3F-like n=1 Tax=Hippopotamus amphibius kiboko TaxID=575201 RepID=UPI0025954295|nr:DNA dC->dU-editing enzyme APOBEC-3F-like [Hippopotamus amphibius kiboko]